MQAPARSSGITVQSPGPRMGETPGRFSRAVRSKPYGAFPSLMLTTEQLSAKMGPSSEPQMLALIGCRKQVEHHSTCAQSRSPTETTARRLAKAASSLEQQTVGRHGCLSQAALQKLCLASGLVILM